MSKLQRLLTVAAAGLLAWPVLAAAQTRQITGRVTRSHGGQPVAEASVTVAGTTNAVRTDAEGRFTITAPTTEARLAVRAIGFTRKDAIVPPGQTSVNFVLDQDVFKLEEVVVSGQATAVERRNVTTSIGYVSGDDVSKVVSATIEKTLYGKLAGVNIQANSGAPGSGGQLQIRGSNTILGAFDPLYVVDGVIYSNARIVSGRQTLDDGSFPGEDDPANRLADLNPADIQSIEVLKGASAAAIYGSKAANGVVIVKTIRGLAGAPRVNLSQRLGTYEMLRKYQNRCFSSVAEAVQSFGPSAGVFLANHPLSCYNLYDQVWGGHRLSYETVTDINGGTEATKYFVSATWKRDNAIEPGTGFGRQALRVNLDQKVGKEFEVSVSSVFNRALRQAGLDNNCNNYACYGYAVAYIPSFVDLRRQPDGTFLNPAAAGGVSSNPLQTQGLFRNNSETYRFTGGTTVTWKAHTTDRSSLRAIGTFGADLFNQNDALWSPNELYYEQPQSRPGTAIQNDGISRQLNWNLNGVHSIRAMGIQLTTSAGAQYEDRRLHTSRVTTDNLVPGQQNINQGSNFVVLENLTPERTFALYGQEEILMLDERLLISGRVRAERSSANGNINKYFFYPGVSAKYSFRDVLGAGSEFKLRAAYGQLGNQPNFGNKFTTLNTPQFGLAKGFQVSTIAGDPNIEPERVKEVEGGFDLNFWNGRANVDFSVYRRRTTNLLLSRTPAPSTGFTAQIFNGGEIQNEGIETVVGITAMQTRSFNWVSSTSFTLHRSAVNALPVPGFQPPATGFGGLGVLFIEGPDPQTGKKHSLSRIYGPKYATPGDTTSDVIQGDVGDTEPTFRMGFSNNFSYKSLSLSVVLDWQKGGTVTNLTQLLYDDGKTTPDYGSAAHAARLRDFFRHGVITPYIEPATFVKVREVALNWTVPRRWIQAIGWGLQDLRLGVTARDPLWWTKYSGLDPEVSNVGATAIRSNVDVTPYPPSRSIFFNIAVGF